MKHHWTPYRLDLVRTCGNLLMNKINGKTEFRYLVFLYHVPLEWIPNFTAFVSKWSLVKIFSEITYISVSSSGDMGESLRFQLEWSPEWSHHTDYYRQSLLQYLSLAVQRVGCFRQSWFWLCTCWCWLILVGALASFRSGSLNLPCTLHRHHLNYWPIKSVSPSVPMQMRQKLWDHVRTDEKLTYRHRGRV